TAFGEVQPVARRSTYAVVREPVDRRGVDASLEDEVFNQSPDVVVHECGDEGGAAAEATPQAAGNVVFAAALPDLERARRPDAPFARIESEHHFAQGHDVVPAC